MHHHVMTMLFAMRPWAVHRDSLALGLGQLWLRDAYGGQSDVGPSEAHSVSQRERRAISVELPVKDKVIIIAVTAGATK